MDTEDLIGRWEKALVSYGIPKNFADDTIIKLIHDKENSKNIPIILYLSLGYSKRREIMKNTKRNLQYDCFLCENMAQAREKGNNLLLPWEEYCSEGVVPNKFPFARGHSLLIKKEHDNPRLEDKLLNKEYFETIIHLSEKHKLSISRNHKFAGRSIPEHEHCHILPKFVKSQSGDLIRCKSLIQYAKFQLTPYNRNVFFVSNSHFDTIAIKKENLDKTVLPILKKLDKNKVIFTFCFDEMFYITPHSNSNKSVGSGDPEYLAISKPGKIFSYKNHINLLKNYIFSKGTFPWKNYLS